MSDSIVLFIILLALAFAWYVYQNETARMMTATTFVPTTAAPSGTSAAQTTRFVATTRIPATTPAAEDDSYRPELEEE